MDFGTWCFFCVLFRDLFFSRFVWGFRDLVSLFSRLVWGLGIFSRFVWGFGDLSSDSFEELGIFFSRFVWGFGDSSTICLGIRGFWDFAFFLVICLGICGFWYLVFFCVLFRDLFFSRFVWEFWDFVFVHDFSGDLRI